MCGGGYIPSSVAPEGRSTVPECMAWAWGCPGFSGFWSSASGRPCRHHMQVGQRSESGLCAPLV